LFVFFFFYYVLYTIHLLEKTGGSLIMFSGQSTNSDEITQVPGGSIELSVKASSSQPTPEGVTLMKLIRRESDNVIVPCLDGISGSWLGIMNFVYTILLTILAVR